MYFPISAIIFSIGAFIFALLSYKIFLAKKKKESLFLSYFLTTIVTLVIALAIFALDLWFFSSNSYLLSIGKIIGDFILFLSITFGIKVSLYLWRPKISVKYGFYPLFVISVILTIIQIFSPPKSIVSINGVVLWNINSLVAWSLVFLAALMWVPTGLKFFIEGLSIRDKVQKIRFFLLALGFLVISLTGPIMVVTQIESLIVASQVAMTLGFGLLFAGMFYKGTIER